MRRAIFLLMFVLVAAAITGEAVALTQIPATAGMVGNSMYVNPPAGTTQIWQWAGDTYIKRPTPAGPVYAEWVIPLQYDGDGTDYKWRAWVMVSTDTKCSLKWRGGTLPNVVLMTTTEKIATSDGLLELTDPSLCPGGVVEGCTHNLASAFVSCSAKAGGYIGSVTYTVTKLSSPTPEPSLTPPGP